MPASRQRQGSKKADPLTRIGFRFYHSLSNVMTQITQIKMDDADLL